MEGASGIAWQTCCVAFAVGEVFLAGLWFYAWSRTKLMFFALLSVAYVGFSFISVIVALLAFDGSLGQRILGEAAYDQFRIWFFAMQPFVLLVSLVGYIKMVRWILRCHPAQSSNQAMQPTASPRTASLSHD
jgi:hypothetical protein